MPLDTEIIPILELLESTAIPEPENLSAEELRGLMAAIPIENPTPVHHREDTSFPGPDSRVSLRIYHPTGTAAAPLLMFFHGGGFVIGDLDSHEELCRRLCAGIGAVVVSVDYRRAPEAKFPAAPEDCYAATCWAVANASRLGADATRLYVAGDSAGGNLAAVVAIMSRERQGPEIAHQILIYPVTDCAFETRSYNDNATGYYLTKKMMQWFWQQYLGSDDQRANPLASPLRAKLDDLPSATIITAEYDPLLDEGKAYADALISAGVEVNYKRFAGMIHGFVSMPGGLTKADLALDYICRHAKHSRHQKPST